MFEWMYIYKKLSMLMVCLKILQNKKSECRLLTKALLLNSSFYCKSCRCKCAYELKAYLKILAFWRREVELICKYYNSGLNAKGVVRFPVFSLGEVGKVRFSVLALTRSLHISYTLVVSFCQVIYHLMNLLQRIHKLPNKIWKTV